MNATFRTERDLLGELPIPADALHGIHTARALENFPLASYSVHPELARAFGDVKLACARTNRALGAWADDRLKADAIDRACRELANGDLGGFIIVDALQGGAGTSTNMNVNEVLANRALEIISEIRSSRGDEAQTETESRKAENRKQSLDTLGSHPISTGLQPGESRQNEAPAASAASISREKPLKRLETADAAFTGLKPLVSTQVHSLPARNEWGESRREGKLNETASSPRPSPPSCVRRRGGKPSAITAFSDLCRYQWLKPGVNERKNQSGPPHVGCYEYISPLDDLNLHQSTNDTYPTALRLAAIRLLQALEKNVVALQESFQAAEKKFAHVVKVGRTQFQDAVLTTLGREMSAYAEAINRDRWRIYKCEERLRVVNLGGTAIGTGLAAPRQYIFQVVDQLREITGIGFARAENLVDATQNADVFVEVSGILKAHAVSLLKICGDLRLLSSGPEAGFGEIRLPARQAGSSIMPGKVNPVIPEAVSQAAMRVIGHDATITMACAAGSLELNPFLPLIADSLLDSLDLLARANDILRRHCIEGLEADEARCRRHVENSTASATTLVPVLGYERAGEAAKIAGARGQSIRETVMAQGWLTGDAFDDLISPEAVCRLGMPARSADFQVCCVASFQTCARPEIRPSADLEIGDTAGLETCATTNTEAKP